MSARARRQNKRSQGPRRGVVNAVQNNIDGMTKKVGGPADPPEVSNDLFGEKVVQLQLQVGATGFNVTAATIAGEIAGGSDIKFRIKRVSAWAPAGAESRIRLTMQDPTSDGAEYADNGTQGSKRAAVHVRFGLLSSIQWRSGSNIDPIFHLDSDMIAGLGFSAVVHVSIQYRLPAPTTPTTPVRRIGPKLSEVWVQPAKAGTAISDLTVDTIV